MIARHGQVFALFAPGTTNGAYILSHPNMRMPEQGKYYSVNEAYRDSFPVRYAEYIDRLRAGVLGLDYAPRYIGSMVADFHRTLLNGGGLFQHHQIVSTKVLDEQSGAPNGYTGGIA